MDLQDPQWSFNDVEFSLGNRFDKGVLNDLGWSMDQWVRSLEYQGKLGRKGS